jgi:hypothetical protein
MLGIYRVAAQLVASQEVLSSTALVSEHAISPYFECSFAIKKSETTQLNKL